MKEERILKNTLCISCINAVPTKDGTRGCSWSRSLKPVEGWTAEKHRKTYTGGYMDITYMVTECPEYKKGFAKTTELDDEAAIRLRDAIVEMTIRDYRKRLWRENERRARGELPSAIPQENEMRTAHFRALLQGIDPDVLIENLRKEYGLED